ncbi:MAG TPA: PilT/PilU family type 4a pilus ATPase [Terriglobales bacterium]|nr:PilT/PilU family type 4a pilus ATPase [Terriglobales bacterium]
MFLPEDVIASPAQAPDPAAQPTAASVSATNSVLTAMLRVSDKVSDLIFSPGRPPQVELNGHLTPVQQLPVLSADDTRRVAGDLIGNNKQAMTKLREQGACDLSYSLPGSARFRVNIFIQRGTCAIVMRVIPNAIPDFNSLNLPPQLAEIVNLKNGIVLITGPTGSGKSSTMAAIVGRMNQERAYHILTIEDPIEFLHTHQRCTVHQRELHSDTPSFALALRAALRQAPKVILVGEMRDRETIEIALEAAETGHLVLSTLHTIDASKTVERIIGVFPQSEQQGIRNRLARSFRYIISQRLLPRQDGHGRVAIIEILTSTLRTREYVEKGERDGKTLLDAMRTGEQDRMQHFDGEIEKLIRSGIIDLETGLSYATNAGNLRLELADLAGPPPPEEPKPEPPKAEPVGETELEIER